MFSRSHVLSYRSLNILRRGKHSQYLSVCDKDGTREITLADDKTRNSLSLNMMNCLIEAINEKKDDKSTRAIVLTAKGKVFSAGHNLKELKSEASGKNEHIKKIFDKATELMFSIVHSPVPVIAKVNGLAAAAGCQLVAQCDMLFCSDTSTFSTPGANFGIFCSTPGIAVARCMPKSRAMYMLVTGEAITAQEAYQSGLVTKYFPADKLDEEVKNIINKIQLKSRCVVELGKQFYYKQRELDLCNAYELGSQIMTQNVTMIDGQEGILSFIEKRKAVWKH